MRRDLNAPASRRIPKKAESYAKLLVSIAPEGVIFAGNHYLNSLFFEESDADITLLSRTLHALENKRMRFLLLSSTEVYGDTEGKTDESGALAPRSERGIRFAREEHLFRIYREQFGLDGAALRASKIYENAVGGGVDFLSRSFRAVVSKTEGTLPYEELQPLHAADFVDAILKALIFGKNPVYNVCSSADLSTMQLDALIAKTQGIETPPIIWEKPPFVTLADASLIQKELGWQPHKNLEEQLLEGEITYEPPKKKKPEKERITISMAFRQSIEHLFIFAAFFALDALFQSNSLFAKVNWPLIYVVVVAIYYGSY